jgi:ribosomal-protein-alanine N-acetyltransferase
MTLVRPAGVDDVPAVAGLETTCLGPDAWSGSLVSQGIVGTLPTVSYLVAEDGGEVIGHAVTSIVADIAELQRIAVAAEHRRRGVAGQLLRAAVDAAARTEADRMLLEVRVDNRPALAFYAAQGFVEIVRRERYYADGTTAAVLRLPLGRGCGGEGAPG